MYITFMITIIISPADIFYQVYLGIPFLSFLEILILINLWCKSYLIRQPIKTN
jgi:Sec-independent protein secretion pathway component TatC